MGTRTGNGVVSAIFGSHPTVAVTVEARHGFLGEEGERLFEDCSGAEGRWLAFVQQDAGTERTFPVGLRL